MNIIRWFIRRVLYAIAFIYALIYFFLYDFIAYFHEAILWIIVILLFMSTSVFKSKK